MASDRVILCGDVPDTRIPQTQAAPVRLRLWGRHPNVFVRIEDVEQALAAQLPPLLFDLLDIATFVYAADQAVSRGSTTDRNFGQDWRRQFFFRIAVADVAFWRRQRVTELLTSTLAFLSEDSYQFEFEPLLSPRPIPNYFRFRPMPSPRRIQEVVMFSVGMDSLGGAIQEAVVNKRPILLVNHRSTAKLSPRQDNIVRRLRSRAEEAPPAFVPVRINKERGLSHESSQRTRSFLYATLGAVLAIPLGLSRVLFYENGVVSLNLPASAQLVGTRASRTTHPRVLEGLSGLFRQVAGRPFEVNNPFRWTTRTEIVRQITAAGCSDLIPLTVSCGDTRNVRNDRPHCGKCSQCIDRRFAVLAAGQEAVEPADLYRTDLYLGEREDGHPRTMLSVYVELMRRITRMPSHAFFGTFGEAARVLRHAGGSESPEEVAQHVFRLYRRHAEEVWRVALEGIGRHSEELGWQSLPPSCLVRLLTDSAGAAASGDPGSRPAPALESAGERPDYFFVRRGDGFDVRFAGGTPFILLGRGAAYLQLLLARPNVEIPAAELIFTVARNPALLAQGEVGRRADADELAGLRVQFEDLERRLEQARTNSDLGLVESLQRDIHWISEEVQKRCGLRGRVRSEPSDREKVRKSVQAAIRRAREKIRRYCSPLAEHLSGHRLVCGCTPCYRPGQDIQWET